MGNDGKGSSSADFLGKGAARHDLKILYSANSIGS
jgi:hypothetical protein